MISGLITVGVAALSLIFSTIALTVVLLRRPKPTDTPVEGINGLSDALTAGSDLPTAILPRPTTGTTYAASHR